VTGVLLISSVSNASPRQASAEFGERVRAFRDQALEEGIPRTLVENTLENLRPDTQVLKNLRNQPEFSMNYARYRELFINEESVKLGRTVLDKNRKLLSDITDRYRVPPSILVAIWGIESHYGRHRGKFDVIRAVSTLAFGDSDRNSYFQNELMATLKILKADLIPRKRLNGSWAGAMGEPQFMPSSYLNYAVDYDGDGKRDLWESRGDILASIANYLAEHGWQHELPWGWRTGTRIDKDLDTRVLKPEDYSETFVVTANFDVIKRYNPSDHYALTVGELARKLEK